MTRVFLLSVLIVSGCHATRRDASPLETRGRHSLRAAAIAHGGVGGKPEHSDGCRAAVDAALAELARSNDPLAAAVAGTVVMEDDPRFNAGTGSRVRIDGETVQMDAALMDSSGRFGAVAVIEKVKNPVRVARAVMDTPHLVLAGDGATRFARQIGMAAYDPATEKMKAATREIQQRLLRADPKLPRRWRRFDWRGKWNFERTLKEAGLEKSQLGSDTVGVAVRTTDGRFAAALSTGGTSITLRGRIGDVPVMGAGLFAGPAGAVAATGTGERIIEAALGRTLHRWMNDERLSPQAAADRAVGQLRRRGWIGLVVIGPTSFGAAGCHPMPWAAREAGSDVWQGPGLDRPTQDRHH